MIRVILKTFLLMTFVLTVGLLSISHAQQSTTALTGEWVGNIDSPGRSEFARLSLTENAGEMQRPLKAKLTLVQLEGADPPKAKLLVRVALKNRTYDPVLLFPRG
jgi:hypothetical protein